MKMKYRVVAASVLCTLGWTMGAALLIWSLLCLDLELNMFAWNPEVRGRTCGCFLLAAAALCLTWLSARFTRDPVSHFAALIISLCCGALVVYAVRPEPSSSGVLGGRTPSPFWYRAGRGIILLVPLFLWVWFPMRLRRILKNSSGQGDKAEPVPT